MSLWFHVLHHNNWEFRSVFITKDQICLFYKLWNLTSYNQCRWNSIEAGNISICKGHSCVISIQTLSQRGAGIKKPVNTDCLWMLNFVIINLNIDEYMMKRWSYVQKHRFCNQHHQKHFFKPSRLKPAKLVRQVSCLLPPLSFLFLLTLVTDIPNSCCPTCCFASAIPAACLPA